MASSPFVDHVKLYLKSGRGGNGIVSWRKEKFVPLGGPDGGDGGSGGSIILRGNSQLWTLLDLKYRKHIHAENGQPGQGSKKKGKSAKDEILDVPLGTQAMDAETGEVLGEIKADGETLVLIPGGRGGLGNWQFRTATRQAPEFATEGGEARELIVVLELKVLADVGLVGFPNAGKSTLLSVVTAAKPKIADYPFTTLVPNLGIVKYRDFRSFVMADIPGIIEGAHEGKGLGHQFLRHIERNSVLLFLLPADSPDIRKEYKILLSEIVAFKDGLENKQRLIAISKCDLAGPKELKKIQKKLPPGIPAVFISALTGEGIPELKDMLWPMLVKAKEEEKSQEWNDDWK